MITSGSRKNMASQATPGAIRTMGPRRDRSGGRCPTAPEPRRPRSAFWRRAAVASSVTRPGPVSVRRRAGSRLELVPALGVLVGAGAELEQLSQLVDDGLVGV